MKILDQESITGIAALLVHAAKIDEQYSDQEKLLIKEFIKSYLKDVNNDEILELLVNHPKILERPIIVKNNDAVIGRPPENVEKLF